MMTATVRENLVAFLHRDLVGPAHGAAEVLEDAPKIRYVAGVLFPQESERNESDSVGGVEGDGAGGDDAEGLEPEEPIEDTVEDRSEDKSERLTEDDTPHDDTVTLANSYRPSAMGLSFLMASSAEELIVRPRAAVYESRRTASEAGKHFQTTWKRSALDIQEVRFSPASFVKAPLDKELAEGLRLRIVVRAKAGRRLVTVSMYNSAKEGQAHARTFFQAGFEVTTPDGAPVFLEYRNLDGMPDNEEETALAMLYRSRRVFGVGHGCAAEWEPSDASRARRVATTVVPSVVVPPVEPLAYEAPGLSMQFLRGDCAHPRTDIPAALEALCSRYENWIELREEDVATLEEPFPDVAREHISLCRLALGRMRSGVRLLATDERALQAFMLMNRVMLMQQHHSRLRRKCEERWSPLPKWSEYTSDWREKRGYWRAFQIAFVLMTIPGLVPGDDVVDLEGTSVLSRDLVDLIWFPTGGGKTEAYLAVTAFSIFTSRMYDRQRRGCLVLMRYTLRLLTSQQFQRAASLICACELVRRADPATFGDQPISIGLWVGVSLTPNNEADALRLLKKLRPDSPDAKNPFQLLSCPWCGTELDNRERLGYQDRDSRQVFVCPGDACPFARRDSALPVCVVDESIYSEPPTLLIGTVDKFALLAWKARAGQIFDIGGGPEVIIQDELHLIAGPLGSMVGLYESVIDYLCTRRGRRPKIIASTATIRRAAQQCAALYDRPMFQFPPPGLDASDSYFAVEEKDAPGRMYLGILPTASSSPLTAQIRSVVALQQGVVCVAPPGQDEALDPYWTLVQYFGSLKELGRAATFITADIPEFLPTMHRRWGLQGASCRYMRSSEELTSRKNEDEIPRILKRLEVKFRAGAERDEQAFDTVLATNMISVGVDVPRLGLMMVVTQPKSTSEYIQASSRVGRRHPGLVVTLYNAGRPRDRSHYEHFVGYHSAFYRYVEPTSVTPFSPPAMERALHALLVIAGRHIAKWSRPSELDRTDPAFQDFLQFLRRRVEHIDEDHLREFDDIVDRRLREWEDYNPERWGDLTGPREERMLMRVAGTSATVDDPDSWPTPSSMRNVDVECQARVISKYRSAGGPQ